MRASYSGYYATLPRSRRQSDSARPLSVFHFFHIIQLSRGGETGIHKGLKILRTQVHAGSTPAPGTSNFF